MTESHHSVKYLAYIASSEWAVKRKQYWDRHGRSCKKCGSTTDLHVHHHTYVRLGAERLTDLVGLCITCHQQVHDLHRASRSKLSLTKATEQVLGSGLQKKSQIKIEMPVRKVLPPSKPKPPRGKRPKPQPKKKRKAMAARKPYKLASREPHPGDFPVVYQARAM